jgi:hypothetical protein
MSLFRRREPIAPDLGELGRAATLPYGTPDPTRGRPLAGAPESVGRDGHESPQHVPAGIDADFCYRDDERK